MMRWEQLTWRQHPMNSDAPMTLMEVFSVLKDQRDEGKCRHKLIDIVIIAIAAVICGADDLTSIEAFGKAKIEWFKRFLALKLLLDSRGIAS